MRPILFALTLCAASGGAMAAPAVPPPSAPAARPAVQRIDFRFGNAGSDTDFLFRMGMLEGHLMVGHELLQAHQPALALPHFGHPVRELYDDFSDYLDDKKFPAFDGQLADLEAAVKTAPDSPQTEAKYQAVIATIHKARELAPASVRDSVPEMIEICSNTIDAASYEYGGALDHGRIAAVVEYHDSRGYLEYVAQEIAELRKAHPDAAGVLDRFTAVLAKAQWIVDPLLPGPMPRASVGTYRGLAEDAAAVAKH
ncbi:MAG: hypothetical protein M0006_12345 [Magnetospirillum sp.]|nr:hypothetical protein [Magnetospirillum sp.]